MCVYRSRRYKTNDEMIVGKVVCKHNSMVLRTYTRVSLDMKKVVRNKEKKILLNKEKKRKKRNRKRRGGKGSRDRARRYVSEWNNQSDRSVHANELFTLRNRMHRVYTRHPHTHINITRSR